ncbi:tetratricopeptide repeat domain-containing protein [Trichoderma breve]|uniref:Tetratricopeptide repeat domain-containing protein n=1 Tax=Trichoderma breve TaxID=2034170 RepID=A0A9W9BL85_9HYPO|nr:tetratricopeptide repeat domain-containing protein [Trichoderma breve]KAJ4861943.1 tetratricopeptide repeat domain-containing protein [Trichoderma breve]
MSSTRVIESNTIGNDARIHQGNVIHNYASAPREPCILIPFLRNEELVCRQDIVSELDRILPLSDDYSTAALYGLGGSGQIALDYAYRRCQVSSCSVFWVHADNETTFTQDFKSIAKKLGLSASLDDEEFLMAVRYGIESSTPWVLILDNADNLGLFGVNHNGLCVLNPKEHELSLDKFIPRGPRGQVLWTSRDKSIAGSVVAARRAIKIPKMTPSEAKKLFESVRHNQRNNDDTKDVEELLEELECLPLAISQAAAYVKRTSTSVKEYVSKLKDGKKRWRILKQSQSDRHRRHEVSNSILETWNISMKYLQAENKTAYQILHTHAYLDNQNISIELIKQAALYASNNDDDKVTEAIARLCDFSFLNIQVAENGNRAYKVHKLVQEAMRYGLSRKERKNEGKHFSAAALEIAYTLFPRSPYDGREVWNKCEKYIAHAQQAYTYYKLGRYQEAEETQIELYRLQRDKFGDKNPRTIMSEVGLAMIHFTFRRYEKAEEIMVRVLARLQKILGNTHRDTMKTMRHLAITYLALGRREEGQRMIMEVLELQQQTFGHKDHSTVITMANIAAIHHSDGRYQEAEGLRVEVLALQREILSDKDPDTITTMANLGITYNAVGKYKEAEEMLLNALALQREVIGDKHPHTIGTMAHLGITYHASGRYMEAEGIQVKALALQQEFLGDEHPETMKIMEQLADTRRQLERLSIEEN